MCGRAATDGGAAARLCVAGSNPVIVTSLAVAPLEWGFNPSTLRSIPPGGVPTAPGAYPYRQLSRWRLYGGVQEQGRFDAK